MSLNKFHEILQQYSVVAVDEYNDEPSRVYLAKRFQQITELSEVILIDFYKQEVTSPTKLGSYAKFMCPVRYVDPLRDNVDKIQKRIESLSSIVKINLLRIIEGKPEIRNEGFGSFYRMDDYLFNDLNEKFHKDGCLNSFDFFCIIIWKANRAKSKIAQLLHRRFNNLDDAAYTITSRLNNQNINDYERFKYLLDLGFRLPMLTAILAVLYPDRFLVYDYRICSNPEMNEFKNLENEVKNKELYYSRYLKYMEAVIENTPSRLTLRQKDQYLWGKSFANQLKEDIQMNFHK